MQDENKLEWEIEDLEKAESLIEHGYFNCDVYILANMLYNKRMKQEVNNDK